MLSLGFNSPYWGSLKYLWFKTLFPELMVLSCCLFITESCKLKGRKFWRPVTQKLYFSLQRNQVIEGSDKIITNLIDNSVFRRGQKIARFPFKFLNSHHKGEEMVQFYFEPFLSESRNIGWWKIFVTGKINPECQDNLNWGIFICMIEYYWL